MSTTDTVLDLSSPSKLTAAFVAGDRTHVAKTILSLSKPIMASVVICVHMNLEANHPELADKFWGMWLEIASEQ